MPADTIVRRLRAGLLALAALGVIGTAIELATIRHWESPAQLIPWAVLLVVTFAIVAVAWRPVRWRVRTAQLIGLGALAAGAYGVLEHVSSNMESAPLDRHYGPIWDSMSVTSQWWAAMSGAVGPSPVLAPAILVQIGLCLLLATLAHPALASGSARPADVETIRARSAVGSSSTVPTP